ncbi:agmatine deiminase [Geoalkalibacter ferrihydriticus]|uniref:Agmatine deiminase n=2 Tax=Geoalkalibacter ferrihydriticus TaxID=392333 RepID=A0A0C2DU04_9BACT|nr:agmatine deiminase family protein [Geoalkalibacter ferrihydriticus]KIH76934.1 agmatine deiminase [Geoalkalibacter ferrihydriticus DSM 17813]SDL43765.1 agmatine deiminase [Geoalkalibacter ferrihydriticus]
MNLRLPAEWEEQDGVLLAWPHAASDWAPLLDQVVPVFTEIACQISRFESVVIVAPNLEPVRRELAAANADLSRFRLAELPTNDTWARDFGPITVEDQGKPCLLDFGFNGWGLKFAANYDNQVTRGLVRQGIFGSIPLRTPGLILEGGSLESDGRGTLLTTSECLLNPNRNPHLDRAALEAELAVHLGAKHFLWLESGYLAGDDTDSHIDTLARLAPEDTILYVACDDKEDEHYEALRAMRLELENLRTPTGQAYRLLPLPWPAPHFEEEDGRRLPATYANFLVINGAVLVPTYGDVRDTEALSMVGKAFAERAIIGIDCSALIRQHGSLHCVTMQLPKGVLA